VRRRDSFRGEGTLEAWCWKAVLNAAHSRRRVRRSSEPIGGVHENGAEPSGERGDERVRAVIAAFPERQRTVLFLRYFADLDYRASAQVTGMAAGTVGATLHAAHAAVRAALEEVRS
jgi:RNA polymerase sigma factor (sigma-70 family)